MDTNQNFDFIILLLISTQTHVDVHPWESFDKHVLHLGYGPANPEKEEYRVRKHNNDEKEDFGFIWKIHYKHHEFKDDKLLPELVLEAV